MDRLIDEQSIYAWVMVGTVAISTLILAFIYNREFRDRLYDGIGSMIGISIFLGLCYLILTHITLAIIAGAALIAFAITLRR